MVWVDVTEHLVIRKPKFVGGTLDTPEFGILCQANPAKPRRIESSLKRGQRVWLKWASGPVVSRAEVLDWESGSFTPNSVEQLRGRTKGTPLFGARAFWDDLKAGGPEYFLIVRLANECVLDRPIKIARSSHGSSWIVLRSSPTWAQ